MISYTMNPLGGVVLTQEETGRSRNITVPDALMQLAGDFGWNNMKQPGIDGALDFLISKEGQTSAKDGGWFLPKLTIG